MTMNKLASLEDTLVETTTESLTRVKCRATSVAKNEETNCIFGDKQVTFMAAVNEFCSKICGIDLSV